MSTSGEGLLHAEGGGVVGFELESAADISGGCVSLIVVEFKASEDEICLCVGTELDGCLCLGASAGGVAALLADLGKSGVGFGRVGIGGERGLKLLLSLGDEALREVVAAKLEILRGLLGRRKGSHASGTHLVELEGGLTERGLGVGAPNAFEWLELRGWPCRCLWFWECGVGRDRSRGGRLRGRCLTNGASEGDERL